MRYPGWLVSLVVLSLVLALPLFMVLLKVPGLESANLYHLTTHLLPDYLLQTGLLVVGVSILVLSFGVGSAWLVTAFDFPLRKLAEWMLILPLAIPSFIGAIAYAGLTDYAGPIRTFLRFVALPDPYIDVMNIYGVILVMSAVLYPYVYLTSRASFLMQSGTLIEASRSLGLGMSRTFFKVVMPVTWPAMIAGLSLVIMEVLNDYGTVKYFGVSTFTTGIFKSWLALGDLPSAIFLSVILVVFVLALLLLEEWSRGRRRFVSENQEKHHSRVQLTKGRAAGALVVVLVPIFVGFLIPVGQMLFWLVLSFDRVDWSRLFQIVGNTVALSLATGVILMVVALIMAYGYRLLKIPRFWIYASKVSLLGYALPGAVTAIGIIATLLMWNSNLALLGVVGLLFGYQVRFFAVGFQAVESGFKKVPQSVDDAALTLGSGPLKNLFRIHMPLLRTSLLSGFILTFVDVTKELPITLILRPFNFETLATNAFQYATDEMAPASAAASLFIIFVGLVPVYLLNKWLSNR